MKTPKNNSYKENHHNRLSNQKGQMITEMVLMIVVVVGVAMAVGSAFRDNKFFATLVSGPWQSLAGLIQNGVWGTPEKTMAFHPSTYERLSTPEGDKVE